jgi:hypothetical protein
MLDVVTGFYNDVSLYLFPGESANGLDWEDDGLDGS